MNNLYNAMKIKRIFQVKPAMVYNIFDKRFWGDHMNILYLISFVETVKQNSISKASKKLHITQSALSQQLQNIEKELNCELLKRSNKGVELTQEGEIIFSYAETIIELYNNMLSDIDKIKNDSLKEIKISSCSSVSEYLLPCTIHIYKKSHKNVRFSIKTEKTKQVIEHVKNKIYDIGFIDDIINDEELEQFNICSNDFVIIFNNKKFKIPHDSFTIDIIKKYPLILINGEHGIRNSIERLIEKSDIRFNELNIEIELDTIEAIKQSVSAGHGISIVPLTSVKKEVYLKLFDYIPLNTSSNCCISMIYTKESLSKEHVREFIDFIKRTGKETFC